MNSQKYINPYMCVIDVFIHLYYIFHYNNDCYLFFFCFLTMCIHFSQEPEPRFKKCENSKCKYSDLHLIRFQLSCNLFACHEKLTQIICGTVLIKSKMNLHICKILIFVAIKIPLDKVAVESESRCRTNLNCQEVRVTTMVSLSNLYLYS